LVRGILSHLVTRTNPWPSERLEPLQAELTATRDSETIPVESPVTGDTYATLPTATPEDVAAAVADARDAASEWRDRSVAERAAVLERFSDLVLDHRGELCDLVQRETGKSRRDAVEEVFDVAATADYYAGTAGDVLATERRRGIVPGLVKARVHHHPVGVVGVIAPWNYPLSLAISDALPALVAGNAVVCKPAEETTHVALLARKLLVDAGLPPDLFRIVPGRGPDLGPPLVEAVDYVAFTGSTAAGREVAALAGEHLTDVSLELGGKNPLLVLDDADPRTAARRSVRSCFANAGQLCLTTERLYVHEDVYEEFRAAFVAAVEEITLGFDYEWQSDVGPLLSAAQFEKTREHVTDAVERGATVLTGGDPRPDLGPYFHEPTVLADVPPEAAVHDDETFGPVVTLYRVGDTDEAVTRANDSEYGLNAVVWTGDTERGERVAARLDCGTVAVNEGYTAVWGSLDTPMGGRNDSGVGRRHGPEGLLRYTESQTVATQRALTLGPGPLPERLWAAGLETVVRGLRYLW
jgi:succinate-semialdehyde dehydrogenase/glutarate-semialdehyde dehydrogenase